MATMGRDDVYEAGPSRRRWWLSSIPPRDHAPAPPPLALAPLRQRQAPPGGTGTSASAIPTSSATGPASGVPFAAAPLASGSSVVSVASVASAPSPSLATSPTSTLSSSGSAVDVSLFATASSSSGTPTSAWSDDSWTSPALSSARSFTSLWSNTRTSRPAATPTFVPGITYNLTLAGARADEAIYAVEVEMGHGGMGRRDLADTSASPSLNGKRQSGNIQTMRLQVDLGSSDMWVARDICGSPDCRGAPALFDGDESIQSGVAANITYHSGAVSGTIMWESVTMSTFAIAYQAFIAADRISSQDLDGGDYSGVLGLALPANSVISSLIPGTTTSNPDGATFLDNLFGSGAYAPTQRIFSLALERREDVRTFSRLTIGSVLNTLCPDPCRPEFISIIPHPNLGPIGYLHWRVPLMGVRATKWDDQARGTGAQATDVTLGASVAVAGRTQPVAVLDSGGVAVLVGNQAFADAIYAPYGVSASSDGLYRLPCKTQLALSFRFGSKWFPAHPLDMSWPDPSDPSQATCIGALQYTPQLGAQGDFVFGSSFLKNVYSVFSYPDPAQRGTWTPAVGLYSLSNASVASQDFYAVRYLRQSLSSVSSSSGPGIGGLSPNNPNPPAQVPPSGSGGGSVMNTTAIVAGSVVGFFVLAAAAFCGWWFWLRRKYGTSGRVEYKAAPERKVSLVAGESTRRHRKHESALRQKSMVEGYSDYSFEEEGSWTEGADSVRMAYLPEVPEVEDVDVDGDGDGDGGKGGGARARAEAGAGALGPALALAPGVGRRTSEPGEIGRDNGGDGGSDGGSERRHEDLVDLTESPAPLLPRARAGMQRDGAPTAITPVPFVRRTSGPSAAPLDPRTPGDGALDAPPTPGSARPLLGSSPVTTPSAIPVGPFAQMAAGPSPSSNASGPRRNSRSPGRPASTMRLVSPHSQSDEPLPAIPGLPGLHGNVIPPGRRPHSRPRGQVRSGSMSMSGPFPGASHQLETSPMYDIRAGDYFDVVPVGTPGSLALGRRRGSEGVGVGEGEGVGVRGESRERSESRGRASGRG